MLARSLPLTGLLLIGLSFSFVQGGVAYAGPVETAEELLERGELPTAYALLEARTREVQSDVAAAELFIDLMGTLSRGTEAEQIYLQRAQSRPSADAWYLAARATVEPNTAAQRYQAALQLEPEHARAWMGMGAVQRSKRSFISATESYGRAVARDPTLAEAWTGLIATWRSQGDRDQALATARRAVAAAPRNRSAWLTIAELAPGEAVITLEKASVFHPTDGLVQMNLARACFSAERWGEAAAAYRRASQARPDDADVRTEAALVDEVRSGLLQGASAKGLLEVRSTIGRDPAGTLQRLDAIVKGNPRSGWALLVRGNVRQARGQLPGAEEDLRAALDRMPGSADVAGALGGFLLGQRRPLEARTWLAQAATARPDDVNLVVGLPLATAESGDVPTAEAGLRAAIRSFPGSASPPLALSRLLLKKGDPQGALSVLVDALERHPDPGVAAALASTATRLGRVEEAALLLEATTRKTGDPRYAKAAATLRESWNKAASSKAP